MHLSASFPIDKLVIFPKQWKCDHFCACVLSCFQSCPTLCDPMDYSPPGFSVHGILQARMVESCSPPGDLPNPGIELASPASPALAGGFFLTTEPPGKLWSLLLYAETTPNESGSFCFRSEVVLRSWKWKHWSFSHVWLFATPWTIAHQAFLSMEFSKLEYWSR